MTGVTGELLLVAKELLAEGGVVGSAHLTAAARSLIDALNRLLELCPSGRPGVKECESALRDLEVGNGWCPQGAGGGRG